MALINNTDKFIKYRYEISEFIILLPNETKTISTEKIVNMTIENYFDSATFPIFKVTTVLEPSLCYKIIENKTDVKFKVRIQKYYMEDGLQDKSLYTDVINKTFSIFLNNDNSDYEKSLKKQTGTEDDTDRMDKVDNQFDLYLFDDTLVTGLRSNLNDVLSSSSMSTAVAYLLSEAGASNVLMSPMDNNRIYSPLVLPPQSIIKQLKYLDNNYGFYRKGAIIFFGLLNSYILDFAGGSTAYTEDEYRETVIFILEKTNPRSSITSSIIRLDEERFYLNVISEGIDISNHSVTTNVLAGNNAYAIDPYTNSTSYSEASSTVKGNKNTNMMINDSSNEYMSDTYQAQMNANGTILTFIVTDINIEALNPNKKISVIFEDSGLGEKFKGTYMVTQTIFNFVKDGVDFAVRASVVMKKVG